MKFRTGIITLCFCLFAALVSGQGGVPTVGEGTVIYKKEIVGGVILHSDGWGANLRLGTARTGKTKRVLEISGVTMKHPKEYKSFNPYYEDSRGYIFGKQNSVFILRPTYGVRKALFDKMRNRAVEAGYYASVGPSLAFAKPIYLEIGYPSVPYERISIEKYDVDEHFVDNIFGKASGTRGLDEVKIYPGLHTRFGLVFEYSDEKDGIKALEAGVAADVYPQEIPIMAPVEGVNNKRVFLTFYVNLLYGKKYFR